MKKVVIFGTGSTGHRVYDEIKDSVEVIAFLDNDSKMHGKMSWGGVKVLGNSEVAVSLNADEYIIASLTGMNSIKQNLLDAGVSGNKINIEYVSTQVNARINFIRDFAKMNKTNLPVAEGGVFQGEFAKEINSCFPNSTLFLFDTFEGFDKRDVTTESANGFSEFSANHLSITSEDLVLNKLPNKEKAVIRKGYFPETAQGLEEQEFFFVNLDFDLYNPILAGLKFFFPRLVEGGVLLVHDYFNTGFLGVAQAVADFEKEEKITLRKYPIGDHCSIAIYK